LKIIIPSVQVPFIFGGAQIMTQGLADALVTHGHEVEVIRFPFKFSPESYLETSMNYCLANDFHNFNGHEVDKVIALQFPAYYVQHPNKVLWLMHQHRAVYELYEQQVKTPELINLRKTIIDNDGLELHKFNKRFSMCQNVSNRLEKFNGIDSEPVYHPPANAKLFFSAQEENYIFCPSRLESLKRQDLLIKALQYTKSPVGVIIAGEGGQLNVYQQLVEKLGVGHKVRFVGHITEQEKILYYARSLAVFFGPFDEDYGYITLEAMLSSKPVITCRDSGGPLEFVVNGETGFVVKDEPQQIAERIDFLHSNKSKACELGENGLRHYCEKNISWHNVVQKLLS
jgi:glycosyltransferase involved in cell wall biosynthesis